jgi:hypothetical protein
MARHRHGRPSSSSSHQSAPLDSVYSGSVLCVVGNSLLVGKMQNDVDLPERYRKQANKFADLARSVLPGVFRDVFLVPAYSPLIGSLTRVVALVAVFVAGTIPVEECRIVPGFFGSASPRVCERSALAFVLARKVDGAIRSIVLP